MRVNQCAGPSFSLGVKQSMDREGDARGAEEQTGQRRHHLPEAAELPIAGEQGGGVTEAARRLRRIGCHGGKLVDGTLRRVSQRDEPLCDWPHMRRLAHSY